ncbi:MAG: hypothetical protein HQL03_06290 [Nitrospirae bacterium]|nr:hypothetical protein [Nitrospirota bacterium]MBF0592805.1 hypothetical protein [Nitrospirota bacterium]
MTRWHDRTSYKKRFQEWFNGNHKLSFICVHDNKEIWDVAEWVKESMQNKKTVVRTVYSSKDGTLRYELLEQITYGLGEYKFRNYNSEIDTLSKSQESHITVNNSNSVGDNSSAGNDINFSDLRQVTITNISDPYAKNGLTLKKEHAIDLLMNKFVIDIREVMEKEKSLFLLFILNEGGLGGFELNRQHWFLHVFCERMRYIDGIEICVLNETNYEGFIQLGNNPIDKIHAKLKEKDMLEAANEHLKDSFLDPASFCCGAMDPEDKDISYRDFARRLSAAIDCTNEGVS